MSWVAVAVGGGALISGIGSGVSGNQSRQAQARADDDQVGRFRGQQAQLNSAMLGGNSGQLPYYQAIYAQGMERGDQNLINQALQGFQQFTSSVGGPVTDQQRALAGTVSARQTGNLGFHDYESARLAGAAGQAMGGVNQAWTQGGNQLNALAAGGEQAARLAGVGRDRIIRRDASTQENAMNQRSRAQLAASGFGNSTAVGNAMSANARNVGEQRDNALQNNADSRQNAFQAARGQRLGVGAEMLAGRTGAMERQGQNQIGREYQRAADRGALEERNLTRDIGLNQDPINTLAGTLSGSINNPYNGYQVGSVGAGGSGTAMQSLGNATIAGGQYIQNQQNQQEQMRLLREWTSTNR